jgi:hypothetical protein
MWESILTHCSLEGSPEIHIYDSASQLIVLFTGLIRKMGFWTQAFQSRQTPKTIKLHVPFCRLVPCSFRYGSQPDEMYTFENVRISYCLYFKVTTIYSNLMSLGMYSITRHISRQEIRLAQVYSKPTPSSLTLVIYRPSQDGSNSPEVPLSLLQVEGTVIDVDEYISGFSSDASAIAERAGPPPNVVESRDVYGIIGFIQLQCSK